MRVRIDSSFMKFIQSAHAVNMPMVNNDFFNFEMVPIKDIVIASLAIFGGLSGGILLLFVGGVRISQSSFFKRISLTDIQAQSEGYTSNFNSNELGD